MRLLCRLGWHDWVHGDIVGKGKRLYGGAIIGTYCVFNKKCKCCDKHGFYTIKY